MTIDTSKCSCLWYDIHSWNTDIYLKKNLLVFVGKKLSLCQEFDKTIKVEFS